MSADELSKIADFIDEGRSMKNKFQKETGPLITLRYKSDVLKLSSSLGAIRKEKSRLDFY